MSTAYYNENSPKAAASLRELINAGHIAPGIVDERSIEDVYPSDLRGFTQCHFFAGIGVWSYALRAAGWSDDRPVWTGSCPCQPFSAAGEGVGFADERHLWPAWRHLIGELDPTVVLGEQVASKDADPWIDLVHTDMEAMGHAFGAVPFPAAGIGSPNIRDRLYWVAYANHSGRIGRRSSKSRHGGNTPRLQSERLRDVGGLAHHQGGGRRQEHALAGRSLIGDRAQGQPAGPMHGGCARGMEHAGFDHDAGQIQAAGLGQPQAYRSADQSGGSGIPLGRLVNADGRDASAERQQRGWQQRQQPEDGGRRGMAPAATFDAATGAGPTNGLWRDADWLLCRDGKWRPVEPGTFPLAHGAPERVGRLHGYGNAINAEAAKAFIEVVMDALAPHPSKSKGETE